VFIAASNFRDACVIQRLEYPADMFKEMNEPSFSLQGTIIATVPARENILAGGQVSRKCHGLFIYTEQHFSKPDMQKFVRT
jgi:hypothetical protein